MNTERDDPAAEDMEVHGDEPDPLALLLGVAAWESFEKSIRTTNRHLSSDAAYLKALVEGCQASVVTLSQGAEYFRARIMPLEREYDTEPLGRSELGAPLEVFDGGRLNPAGIRYLYLADTDGTAIAETRPWRDARVSVGRFSLVREVKVVDLRGTEITSEPTDPVFWASIALARPAHRDDRLSYVATQLLAGHLEHLGFEGILYDSSLRRQSHNLALFQPDRAIMKDSQLFQVNKLRISSRALRPSVPSN